MRVALACIASLGWLTGRAASPDAHVLQEQLSVLPPMFRGHVQGVLFDRAVAIRRGWLKGSLLSHRLSILVTRMSGFRPMAMSAQAPAFSVCVTDMAVQGSFLCQLRELRSCAGASAQLDGHTVNFIELDRRLLRSTPVLHTWVILLMKPISEVVTGRPQKRRDLYEHGALLQGLPVPIISASECVYLTCCGRCPGDVWRQFS